MSEGDGGRGAHCRPINNDASQSRRHATGCRSGLIGQDKRKGPEQIYFSAARISQIDLSLSSPTLGHGALCSRKPQTVAPTGVGARGLSFAMKPFRARLSGCVCPRRTGFARSATSNRGIASASDVLIICLHSIPFLLLLLQIGATRGCPS